MPSLLASVCGLNGAASGRGGGRPSQGRVYEWRATPLTRVPGSSGALVSYAGAHAARPGLLLLSCRSPVPNEVLAESTQTVNLFGWRGPPGPREWITLGSASSRKHLNVFQCPPLTHVGTPLLLTRNGSMGSRKALSVTEADHTQFAVRCDLAVLTQLFVFLCPCWLFLSSPGLHRHFTRRRFSLACQSLLTT